MRPSTARWLLRLVHLVFGVPIIGYVYSPFEDIPLYAPVVRFVAVPVITLTGLWMWKGHTVRRILSHGSPSSIE